jgi:tetratricopeptide (TPR) repeat protein
MPMKSPSRIFVATSVLSILSPVVPHDCPAQVSPSVQDKSATHSLAAREEQPPFDKLELFGFFAAGPMNSYASQVIQARGTNFTPDATFIASFPDPGFQQILKNLKPRVARTPSPDRDAACELLRKAWEAKQNRQFAVASEDFQQALQLAPNSATLHLAYAASLLLSQNYSVAETQARQSLKLWPGNAEAHGVLALCLTAQKQFEEAESESRETLRIFPEHHSAMFALGLSLTHERKYKEAIPFLRDAMPFLPNLPALKKYLGICLLETGETADGIDHLSLYVKTAPEDAEGHYYLAVGLRQKGNSEGAHSEFAEALRLQPNIAQYEAAAHPDSNRSAGEAVSRPKLEDGNFSENVYTNKFFGFTYEFPKGWVPLSSEAARAVMEIGGAFISTGDPTEADAKKAAERKGHSLLYVVESRVGNQPISMKSVMVSAFDLGTVPGLTPESFLKSIGQRFKQTGVPMELIGAPEQIMIGGRSFWKGNFAVQTTAGTRYGSQFVIVDKGYLLMFSLGSPDLPGLRDIEKSLGTIRFLDSSN